MIELDATAERMSASVRLAPNGLVAMLPSLPTNATQGYESETEAKAMPVIALLTCIGTLIAVVDLIPGVDMSFTTNRGITSTHGITAGALAATGALLLAEYRIRRAKVVPRLLPILVEQGRVQIGSVAGTVDEIQLAAVGRALVVVRGEAVTSWTTNCSEIALQRVVEAYAALRGPGNAVTA